MSKETEVYIFGGARTPMCNLRGAASEMTAPMLGGVAIRGAMEKAGSAPEHVNEVYMGCVLPHGLGQAPARQAALAGGLGYGVSCTTINKMCGSGMKAVMLASDAVKAGSARLVVAGGMESMTNAPHMLPGSRAGIRLGHGRLVDAMLLDGLEDAYEGKLMGVYAQDTADKYGFTREMMDEYAVLSASRAREATDLSRDEIVPLQFEQKGATITIEQDEQPPKVNFEKIPQLKPVFKDGGTVTAANSSCISDGASALVVGGQEAAQKFGLKPLARILGHASHARHPAEFTIAPAFAMRALMERLNLSKDDFDLFEINEAFAVVALYAVRELGLEMNRVNVRGGACAMGHPIGSSGSRILLTLINALKHSGKKRGLAGICIGGGEATALAVELL